jgi:hypothetical protein
MKLSIKQKALLFTIGALAASIIAGLSVAQIIAMIPGYMVPYIGIGFVVIVMAKLLYSLILNDLECKNRLEELSKKG